MLPDCVALILYIEYSSTPFRVHPVLHSRKKPNIDLEYIKGKITLTGINCVNLCISGFDGMFGKYHNGVSAFRVYDANGLDVTRRTTALRTFIKNGAQGRHTAESGTAATLCTDCSPCYRLADSRECGFTREKIEGQLLPTGHHTPQLTINIIYYYILRTLNIELVCRSTAMRLPPFML